MPLSENRTVTGSERGIGLQSSRERGGDSACILVIDDHAGVRELVRAMLEEAGYEVLEAPDAETGMALFYQAPCDLVITDIELPDKDGLDLIQELCYEFPDVKIIAMTGSYGEQQVVVKINAVTFGAIAVFSKPFLVPELLDAVKRAL
jgi:two-component system response regulator SaeR